MGFVPIIVLFSLFALNIPVAYALVVSSLSYFLFIDTSMPVDMIFQRMIASAESFPLLAVPFFIMAGAIMNYAGISKRLMNVADLLTGRMAGGLAHSNVVLSTLMGGISGSQNADAAMESKIIAPEMIKRGFSPAYSAAITAASATISTIIPPGIGLILYSFMANVSVGKMFMAGYLPGLMMCIALMISVHFVSKKRGYAATRTYKVDAKTIFRVLLDSAWALFLPLGIILGLRFGMFTATEAGAVSVFYSLGVGFCAYKELKLSDLPKILLESVLSTAAVMLIIVAAAAFGFYMSYERIPQRLTQQIINLTNNPYIFMLLINLFLLFVGLFIEGSASLIILTPLLVPIATKMGIDLVHFGLIMVLNITIGGVTPPFGTLIFVTTSILNVRFADFVKEVIPCLIALITVLLLLTFMPGLTTFLPNLLM
jgi:tripartite ATP-independent transporter DctM subunit